MKSSLALGLIGAGRWGRNYIETINGLDGVELRRVVTRQSRAARCADTCQLGHDWQEAVCAGDLDGLVIAGPTATNTQMAVFALERGLPVLLEKPPALTVADAQGLLDVVKRQRTLLHINYLDLVNPAWQQLLRELPGTGAIQALELEFGGPGPLRDDVSCLWDWGSHPLALLATLFEQDIPSVERASRETIEDREGECLRMSLRVGGVPVQLAVANNWLEKRRRAVIDGEDATLVYDGAGVERLVLCREGKRYLPAVPAAQPLSAAVERFATAIRDGLCSERDAVLGLRVSNILAEIDNTLAKGRQ